MTGRSGPHAVDAGTAAIGSCDLRKVDTHRLAAAPARAFRFADESVQAHVFTQHADHFGQVHMWLARRVTGNTASASLISAGLPARVMHTAHLMNGSAWADPASGPANASTPTGDSPNEGTS